MSKRERLSHQLRYAMGGAILELLHDKPLDKITVDELTQRAQVGRVTYYRHFHSKQEAISYKLACDWAAYAEDHGFSFEEKPSLELARAFLDFIYGLRETNELLVRNDCRSCILDAMLLTSSSTAQQGDGAAFYRDRFRLYGLFGIVEAWIETGYAMPLDEVAQLTVKYFFGV